ncbi:hypothetical protein Tco_0512395 [Tanacetum coccineum]
MESVKKSIDERALHKREYESRVNERQMQTKEGKVYTSKPLDASLVDTERQQHTQQPEFNNKGEEKVFAIAALKNELRKLKGTSVDTKWVSTGKIFTSSTTKVDNESSPSSNIDIINPHECKQTLDLSADCNSDLKERKVYLQSDDGNPSSVNIKQHCGRYQDKDCQGRLLARFQDDAKYEHVGQDTRSQGGKDLKEKDLKISELKTKSKDNDKGSRSKITQQEGTSLQQK